MTRAETDVMQVVESSTWRDKRWPQPSYATAAAAGRMIMGLGQYPMPFVSSDYDGAITMEWWNDPKKVTLFVYPDSIEFLKSWGECMNTEMEDGVITDARPLMQWLYGGSK